MEQLSESLTSQPEIEPPRTPQLSELARKAVISMIMDGPIASREFPESQPD